MEAFPNPKVLQQLPLKRGASREKRQGYVEQYASLRVQLEENPDNTTVQQMMDSVLLSVWHLTGHNPEVYKKHLSSRPALQAAFAKRQGKPGPRKRKNGHTTHASKITITLPPKHIPGSELKGGMNDDHDNREELDQFQELINYQDRASLFEDAVGEKDFVDIELHMLLDTQRHDAPFSAEEFNEYNEMHKEEASMEMT